MKIKDTLLRDPATNPLINQGQARIADRATDREVQELKGELSTFVCEGQYAEGMQRILTSFLAGQSQTSQRGAWVSGFFGSGKSHLLKMLCHLWQNTTFPDGSAARSLVPNLPEDIRASLRELDTQGKRSGGLFAAAGAMPGGTTDNVRLTVLSVLLRGADFPEQYAQARFVLWLHERGYLERVKAAVTKAGKDWTAQLNDLYVSGVLAKAVMECDEHFATSEAEARGTIREQFKQPTSDITTSEFLAVVRQVLAFVGRGGKIPCTILILDEVQQYIGSSPERSTLVTEVAEALSKQLDGQIIVVAAGQSALSEQPLLHKLFDRFTVRVQLSDTDVETVTRKVLLQKKPSAIGAVEHLLEQHAGEISRQLHDTQIGARSEDRATATEDYPLLPVRRRFWEHVFRTVDMAGTQSQLRSQLSIIHYALAKTGKLELGAIVPADELYDALAPEMVNTGVLLRELNERITRLGSDGKPASRLRQRICGLVFLIGRLPREGGSDIGVRATAAHLADLLVDDLSANNGELRDRVQIALATLVDEGALMRLGDEYRLQTREGAEWDKEFQNIRTRLNNDDVTLQGERERYVFGAVGKVLDSVRVLQGKAKELRRLSITRDASPPRQSDEALDVWMRDGWTTTEKGFVDEARAAGTSGAVLYVFIPKKDDADLRQAVIEAMAAERTLGQKGHPGSPEGQEARRSMESRLSAATARREQVVARIVQAVKVFQGGGNERLELMLEDKLRAAAEASLERLFPRFAEADALATQWESAIKRAREGADQPFQPVGHVAAIEDHPVCRQVLTTVGGGSSGTALRKALGGTPFGWPRDAVDAALIALHRSQHVSATLNGQPVALGQLDQNRIPKAEFRVEHLVLTVSDRIKIRGTYKRAGVDCKAGEELVKAGELIAALDRLRAATGGDAPLPALVEVPLLDDLRARAGNDQLMQVKERSDEIAEWIDRAQQLAIVAAERLPGWRIAERLAGKAASLGAAAEAIVQLETVRAGRMLLDGTDHVVPIRAQLSALLRGSLNSVNERRAQAHADGLESLRADATWHALSEESRVRILGEVKLAPPQPELLGTDEAMLASLDAKDFSARDADGDAVPARVQRAIVLAARELEPKVHIVAVERATLRTDADVRSWLDRQERRLLDELKQGPVLIN
jgi:hypothetical protein